MTVIDTISSFFTELQHDMAVELNAIEKCLDKASTKKEEYKTLGNLLETHKNVQAMPFLQPSSTPTIKDLGNAAAVVDWYLTVTENHFQQLVKNNTIPDEISDLDSSRQALRNWVGKVNTWMSAEETSTSLYPVSTAIMVTKRPGLSVVSPARLVCNIFTGEIASSPPITIKNDGGGTLNWSAKLDNPKPPIRGLSATSGQLGEGESTQITVNFDAKGVHSGTIPQTHVTISATDYTTGKTAAGSSVTILVSITVADNLFMCVMNQLNQGSTVVKRTEDLFRRRGLTLSDRELEKLTKSWDQVVAFVASPSTACSCLNKPLADLITLHSQLEQLYDSIESNVTRSDEDLIGLE